MKKTKEFLSQDLKNVESVTDAMIRELLREIVVYPSRKIHITFNSGRFGNMCLMQDRVDVQIEVDAVPYDDLTVKSAEESSKDIKKRVESARTIQRKRFKDDSIFFNAQMDAKRINKYCSINAEAKAFMKSVYNSLELSARAHSRILKMRRTIADLSE